MSLKTHSFVLHLPLHARRLRQSLLAQTTTLMFAIFYHPYFKQSNESLYLIQQLGAFPSFDLSHFTLIGQNSFYSCALGNWKWISNKMHYANILIVHLGCPACVPSWYSTLSQLLRQILPVRAIALWLPFARTGTFSNATSMPGLVRTREYIL